MRKKTFVLLTSFFFFFLILGVGFRSLICFGMETYLKKSFPKTKRATCNYENCKWRGNSLLFQGVCVIREEEDQEPPLEIHMDHLEVRLDFRWASFKCFPKIVMIRPKIDYRGGKESNESSYGGLYESLNQWFFLSSLNVTEGECILNDQVALISLTQPEGEKNGSFKMGKKGQPPALEGMFWKENDVLKFEISFLEFDVAWAFQMGKGLFPKMSEQLEVTQGILEGTCAFSSTFSRPVNSIAYTFCVKKLALVEKKSEISLAIDHAEWKRDREWKKEEGHNLLYPFFEKTWPSFIGIGKVEGMHVTIQDLPSHTKWSLRDVHGAFHVDPFHLSFMELSGLYQGRNEGRFHLVGTENKQEEKGLGINWDIEIVSEALTQATFSLISKKTEPLLIEMAFKNVTPDLLDLLKHFGKESLPCLDEICVDSGMFSGSASGSIEKGRWGSLSVSKCSASDVQVRLPFKKLTCQAKEVSGRVSVDLWAASPFQAADWEFALSEGDIYFGEKHQLEKVSLSLSMNCLPIRPSLSVEFQSEIEEVAHSALPFSRLTGFIEGSIAPERVSDLIKEGDDEEINGPFGLEVNLTLESFGESLRVTGSCAGVRSKEEKDTLHVVSEWALPALRKGGGWHALKWGEFKGEKISDRFVNLFLIFSNQDYRLKGTLGIEGGWDSSRIAMALDPTELGYRSKYVDLRSQLKKGEKAPSCTFSYEYNKGTWVGKIPLREMTLKEYSSGIQFDSFNSEVYLEGKTLVFQKINALSCNMRFQGQVNVDFSSQDWGELVIETDGIEGEAQDAIVFLRHFEKFKELNLPLKGKVTSPSKGMFLRAHIGEIEELLEWNIGLDLKDGVYPFSSTLGCENLSGTIYYSSDNKRIVAEKVRGTCVLSAGTSPRFYALNVPLLALSLEGGLVYDCRLEDPIHEICRISGRAVQVGEECVFTFDQNCPRFYGAEIDVKVLSLKKGRLNRAQIETHLSALDLMHHLDFLSSAGILPIYSEKLKEMRGAKIQGTLSVKVDYDASKEMFCFDGSGNALSIGPIDWDHLAIYGRREGSTFRLDRFEVGCLSLLAKMEKEEEAWHIPHLEVHWKENVLKGKGGLFNEIDKQLILPIEELRVDLRAVKKVFSSLDFDRESICGTLLAKGELLIDLTGGGQNGSFDCYLKWAIEEFGPGKLRFKSSDRCHLSYHPSFGFSMEETSFNALHPTYHEIWAKCQVDGLKYHKKNLSIKQMRLVVPPEMLSFLGQTRLFPHLKYEEERLIVYDYPIKWENQIEASLEFSLGEKKEVKGALKEGYYWIGNKAWYFNDFLFDFADDSAFFSANVACHESIFDLCGTVTFFDQFFKSRFEIKELVQSRNRQTPSPLTITTDWNPHEGFFIQTIEGGLCGLDFSFHHNPKHSSADIIALTGQLKMNFSFLSPLLPEEIKRMIQSFGIGNGYELSGDLILSKGSFGKSAFLGYLKGKHFELMGSVMETLLSEIQIYPNHIVLSRFNVSDVSGIFSMPFIELVRERENEWELRIPQLVMNDFRPSLLKKIGKCPTRIKPLTIRSLYCHNIQGILGKKESFSAKGDLSFINTFKRDAHILDIPFEILGRLGLDMGLLIPVRGDLEFTLLDGRVYLTRLKKSYSEGKRSQFFISPVEQSYIDLQGNINIQIKMKQFVLLKVTEPFTLHVGGTFENPKYSLR